MSDEFDRKWLEIVTRLSWIETTYALIGLTRLGERLTTVERLAAADADDAIWPRSTQSSSA
jgi:hypothetical protein